MINEMFGSVEINFIIGLIFSVIIGYMIGAEREGRMKDAGISTHIMVIVGAMLFTILSDIVDPHSKSRIAAQIVTGVGFLGAGLILKDRGKVKNLTTAASLWVAAAIGMAFGYGYHIIGIVSGFLVVVIPRIPYITGRNPNKKEDDDLDR